MKRYGPPGHATSTTGNHRGCPCTKSPRALQTPPSLVSDLPDRQHRGLRWGSCGDLGRERPWIDRLEALYSPHLIIRALTARGELLQGILRKLESCTAGHPLEDAEVDHE